MKSEIASVAKMDESCLGQWEFVELCAGQRLEPDKGNVRLIVCQKSIAVACSGPHEHPIERAKLLFLPGDQAHELMALSDCSLWVTRLQWERDPRLEKIYTCNLETLAAASSMAAYPIEVTSFGDYVLGVHPRHAPVAHPWTPWMSLDPVLSAGQKETDGYMLSVRTQKEAGVEESSVPVDVAVIGAGPAGLSVAAHATQAGFSVAVYGQPMSFWKRSIVPLPLRSQPGGTSIDTPRQGYRYSDFAESNRMSQLSYVPFHAFLAYTQNFIEGHGLQFRRSVVTALRREGEYWSIQTERGAQLAKNVVVAVGLKGMERIPPRIAGWGGRYMLASELQSLEIFRNKNVAVLGSAQSAVEIAMEISNISGAQVTLLARGPGVIFRSIHSPGNLFFKILFKKIDKVFGFLPIPVQDLLLKFLMKGTAEPPIEDRLRASSVRVLPRVEITDLVGVPGKPVTLVLSNGPDLTVDHLVLCTGYRFDVRRVPFLRHLVEMGELREVGGLPILSPLAESSARGLFFAGMSALRLIGPQCQFVFGTQKVTPRILRAIVDRLRQRHA